MNELFDDKRTWILGGLCIAAGVALGLLLAPMTHGFRITMWSNNSFGTGGDVNYTGVEERAKASKETKKKKEKQAK